MRRILVWTVEEEVEVWVSSVLRSRAASDSRSVIWDSRCLTLGGEKIAGKWETGRERREVKRCMGNWYGRRDRGIRGKIRRKTGRKG
jgi:hypothetical protein